MNKNEILSVVSERIDLPRHQTEQVVDAFLDVIVEALEKGDKAVLSGFGTFEIRQRNGHAGVNPHSGERIQIESQKTAAFKIGKVFKEKIR